MIGVIIGLLVIGVLVLVIVQMVGGTKTTITYQPAMQTGPPPLPPKSAAEIKALLEAMPSEWLTYPGATPPLKLHLRGSTYEGLRRVSRKLIDETVGQAALDMMPVEQATNFAMGLNSRLVAEAYVLDWEGARYPNGADMPFSTSNMATRLDADPYLMTFVTEHGHRLSPDWKEGRPPQLA